MNSETAKHESEKSGYEVSKFPFQTKRYCQTLQLKDDPELIEDYKKMHSNEFYWSEIGEGIRSIGILEMEIFLYNTMLVMIVETAVDFDWNSAFDKLKNMPRQTEWEEYMSKFQMVYNKSKATEKWSLMERIFRLQ